MVSASRKDADKSCVVVSPPRPLAMRTSAALGFHRVEKYVASGVNKSQMPRLSVMHQCTKTPERDDGADVARRKVCSWRRALMMMKSGQRHASAVQARQACTGKFAV